LGPFQSYLREGGERGEQSHFLNAKRWKKNSFRKGGREKADFFLSCVGEKKKERGEIIFPPWRQKTGGKNHDGSGKKKGKRGRVALPLARSKRKKGGKHYAYQYLDLHEGKKRSICGGGRYRRVHSLSIY